MTEDAIDPSLPSDIKKEIIKGYMKPSNLYGYFHGIVPMVAAVIAFYVAADASFLMALFLIPLIGWLYYRIYFPLHDCCHYSLVQGKHVNVFLGYVMAAFLVTPFESFRREHVFHHIYYSTEKDPGAVDYYLEFKSRTDMAKFLLLPLWGGTLILKLKEYFHKVENPEKGQGKDSRIDKVGYVYIMVIQAVVFLIVTNAGTFADLWRYPVFVLLPGATVFLFLSRLRMFLEHGSLNYITFSYPNRPRKTSRTFYCNFIELLLLSGAGFKYHYEHHLLPGVPSCHLQTVHEKYIKSIIDPEDLRPSYLSAIAELWRNIGGKKDK